MLFYQKQSSEPFLYHTKKASISWKLCVFREAFSTSELLSVHCASCTHLFPLCSCPLFPLLLLYFSQSYLPSQDSLTSFSWGFPSLFIAQTLSRRIQTQCQIPDCPDWKGLCWIMQSILELRLFGVPKKTQQLHPAFWPQSRRAALELVTKQKPDGVWEGRCTGWEAESVISEVTFATELINVKLLNSPWPCEVHLLRIQVSE